MADYARMQAMAGSALPFVQEWCCDAHHRQQLEVAHSGLITACGAVVSKMHWSGLGIFCWIAEQVLLPEEGETVASWIPGRSIPEPVIAFVTSLSDDALYRWFFELNTALLVVTDWLASISLAVTEDERYLFRHLKCMLVDLIVLVRFGDCGREMDRAVQQREQPGEVIGHVEILAA
eukprot:s1096_g17.t1